MGDKFRFELNQAGVRELLRSPAMAAGCQQLANAAVSRLGSGYGTDIHYGQNRVNVEVRTLTADARAENLKSNTILKALR